MNRVTSTPHHQKWFKNGQHLVDDFENSLSPILPGPSRSVKPHKHTSSLKTTKPSQIKYKPDNVIDGVIPRKKRKTDENKESASRAVLREMGISSESLRNNNMLSVSRNKYDMYPNPVVLDSDEEEEEASTISLIKRPPQKNNNIVKKSSVGSQRVKKSNCRKGVIDDSVVHRVEGDASVQCLTFNKNPSSKKKILSVKSNIQESQGVSKANSKNKVFDHSVVVQDEEEDASVQCLTFNQKTSSKKGILAVKNNIQDSQGVLKANSKKGVVGLSVKPKTSNVRCKPVSLPIELSTRDVTKEQKTILSKNVLKRNLKLPAVVEDTVCSEEDLYDDAIICWTPRANKNKKLKIDSLSDDEVISSDNVEKVPSQSNDQTCKISPDPIRNKENPLTKSVSSQKDDGQFIGNKFDSDCVCHFQDILFKHNKHSGGIVAKALDNGNNNFGYVEVKKDEVFTGQRSNTTFVVLEGEVRASQPPASQILVPGDMLHFKNESQYTFTCISGSHARLLYIKKK